MNFTEMVLSAWYPSITEQRTNPRMAKLAKSQMAYIKRRKANGERHDRNK